MIKSIRKKNIGKLIQQLHGFLLENKLIFYILTFK